MGETTQAARLRSAVTTWRRSLGWPTVALVGLLALAAALRLHGITWGLPYAFVNPDEATVVQRAFHVAVENPNPQFFYYPSFFFYLLAGVYWLVSPLTALMGDGWLARPGGLVVDPAPFYLIGRLVAVMFGVAGVFLVYLLGRAAFGVWTGLLAAAFAAVEPLHVKYSHLAVTDVPATTLSLLSLLFLLRAAQGRGTGWLTAGAVMAGVATSTKYNLGMLVLPATVAAAYALAPLVAGRERRVVAWVRALLRRVYLPMLLAFVLASPFVIIDAPRFVRDFARQGRIVERGWLGFEGVGNTYWHNFSVNLTGALGLVLVCLCLAGLALALWRRSRFDLMVAPYVIVYFAYVSSWKELADRYVLPLLPLLLVFAAALVVQALRARSAWRPALAPAVAALLAAAVLLPLTDSIAYNQSLTGTDVRVRAKAWVERNIEQGGCIASETGGPPLVARRDLRYYRAAGLRPKAYRLYVLKLPVPGEPQPQRSLRWLRCRRVEYVIVSSAVRDRVMAAAQHYPRLVSFYRSLDRSAELVRVFEPRPGERGPRLTVYRLGGWPRT